MKIISNSRPTQDNSGNPLATWTQMQAQINLDDTAQETLVMDYVDAASQHAEVALDSSLLTRTIVAKSFNTVIAQNLIYGGHHNQGKIYLPRGPVQSITSLVDANGSNITNYQLEGAGNADWLRIFQVWVAPLTVTFVA